MWVNDTSCMITSKKYNHVEMKMESSISLSDDSFTIPVLRFREQMRYDYHSFNSFLVVEPRSENAKATVTAKLISALDFTIQIEQFLCFLSKTFRASSHLLCLYWTCSETTLLVFP